MIKTVYDHLNAMVNPVDPSIEIKKIKEIEELSWWW